MMVGMADIKMQLHFPDEGMVENRLRERIEIACCFGLKGLQGADFFRKGIEMRHDLFLLGDERERNWYLNELPRSKLTRYHPVSREQSELLSKIFSL